VIRKSLIFTRKSGKVKATGVVLYTRGPLVPWSFNLGRVPTMGSGNSTTCQEAFAMTYVYSPSRFDYLMLGARRRPSYGLAYGVRVRDIFAG